MEIAFAQIASLDGQPVLVKPAITESQNSVGMRGSIRVRDVGSTEAAPNVEIVLGFPEMYYRPAHEKIIPLSGAAVQELLLSKLVKGGYEYTLEAPVDAVIHE